MNAEQLSKVGSDLVRRCGTRDPFQIAKELGIIVLDDCENFGQLKGMYRVVKKNRFIFLNQDLSPQTKRIVCAHEIGHDRLHRALAKGDGLQEFVLYKMNSIPEYEANIVVHFGADCTGNAYRHQLDCLEDCASGRDRA